MFDVQSLVFWLIASFTGLCAIATVVSHNIVRSATWLLFTLAGTSGIFFLVGADFVGAIQLLIYVGGTMVLVVFGVMLTAQGPFISMKTTGAEWAISLAAGMMLFAVLCFGISENWGGTAAPPLTNKPLALQHAPPLSTDKKQAPTQENPQDSHNSATIGQTLVGAPYGPVYERTVDPDGKTEHLKRTHYLLPFEIVSVHLLVVLIGAAYLARAKRHRGEQT